jgi:phospholipase/carboxylesterase
MSLSAATPKLEGPALEPHSGAARRLVVILHGFGADGHDLISIGAQWARVLPDAAFMAPHAHEPCEYMPSGRQWFRLTDRNPHERWTGACAAAPVIDAFLDAELAARGLDDSALALAGFSQGAMMALHVGLRRRKPPAAILAYSGALIGPERLADATAGRAPADWPPIMLIHGSHDDVVPVAALHQGAQAIAAAGGACQTHVAQGLGHGIDAEGLTLGALFLAQSFGLPAPEGFSAA